MKHLLIASGLALSLAGAAFAQDNHAHHKTSKKTSTIKLNPKDRFAAENDLKTRMEKILNTLITLYTTGGDKNPAKIKEAGVTVEETVSDIFKTCKLEPAADEAIHPVLADILQGATHLKEGNAKKGHDVIHAALVTYEGLFAHEIFKSKK